MHSPSKKQWVLSDSSSSILIAFWHDEAARNTSLHLPPFPVISKIGHWFDSRKLVLREINEALSDGCPRELSVLGRGERDDFRAIKARVAEAFRTGRLIALKHEEGAKAQGPVSKTQPKGSSFKPIPPVVTPEMRNQKRALPAGSEDSSHSSSTASALSSQATRGPARRPGNQHNPNGILQNPLWLSEKIDMPAISDEADAQVRQENDFYQEQGLKEYQITRRITSHALLGAGDDPNALAALRSTLYYYIHSFIPETKSELAWDVAVKFKLKNNSDTNRNYLVEIQIGAQGQATIELLGRIPSVIVPQHSARAATEQLQSLYDITVVGAGRQVVYKKGSSKVSVRTKEWTKEDLSDVLAALALVPKQDHEALRGLELLRLEQFPFEKSKDGAFQLEHGKKSSLRFDDDAFEVFSNFHGDGSNPYPRVFRTILHEVAHAVEKEQIRYGREPKPGQKFSSRLQRFIELAKKSEVTPFTEYARDTWYKQPGPKTSNNTGKPQEFFAEAYAFWLIEPDFLKSYYRVLFDFFETKKYRQ